MKNKLIVNGETHEVKGSDIIVRVIDKVTRIFCGKECVGDFTGPEIKLSFEGALASLDCTSATINGNILGDVDCTNLTCNDIGGDVDATNVRCNRINGDVDATNITVNK